MTALMTRKPGRCAVELDAEEELPPDEHDRELQDGDAGEIEELAEQQRRHRHAGPEDAVERAALGLLDERAARARGGERAGT